MNVPSPLVSGPSAVTPVPTLPVGPLTWFQHCSLTRSLSPQTLVSETIRRFGRLDCIVNNAGYRES